jgi:acetylglutamate kinase
MNNDCVLIKLGGSILSEPNLIKKICNQLKLIKASGASIILVHGGAKAVDKMLKIHNISSTSHEGLRITTDEMIDIIEMVLCGHVNKMLIRALNAAGLAAVGLSGSDDNLLQCELLSAMHGKVGKVKKVNARILQYFLATQKDDGKGIIPVVAPTGADVHGNALNVNADWSAVHIALALKIKKIIFLTDQNGIYDENKQIIPALDKTDLEKMIQTQVIKDGMLVKANAIIYALKHGINNIHIMNANMFETGTGTLCKQSRQHHENFS